jgi:hypothetical protein
MKLFNRPFTHKSRASQIFFRRRDTNVGRTQPPFSCVDRPSLQRTVYPSRKRAILRPPLKKPNPRSTVPRHKNKGEMRPQGSAFEARRARRRALGRDPIASLKKESYRVKMGVSWENLEQKARLQLASELNGSARSARSREPARPRSQPHRDRSPARENESSYLAINWQRAAIQVRIAYIGRRFPTPQPPLRNTCGMQ